MVEKTSKAAVTISTASAIMAAIALLKSGKEAFAAVPEGIPQELWNLIIAIAQSADNVDKDMDKLLAALSGEKLILQGWPNNCEAIQTIRVPCPRAAQPYQLPELPIPHGFNLVIKAWPTNAGLIYVGEDSPASTNVNRAYPLNRSEAISLGVTNANKVWISAVVANDAVALISEKRNA